MTTKKKSKKTKLYERLEQVPEETWIEVVRPRDWEEALELQQLNIIELKFFAGRYDARFKLKECDDK